MPSIAKVASLKRNPWSLDRIGYDAVQQQPLLALPGDVSFVVPIRMIAELVDVEPEDLQEL